MKKKDRLRDLSPVDIHLVLTFEWYEWLTDARNAKSIARLRTTTKRMLLRNYEYVKDSKCQWMFLYRNIRSAIFHRGYTKTTMRWHVTYIGVGYGKPKWGAPYHPVFVIGLGNRYKRGYKIPRSLPSFCITEKWSYKNPECFNVSMFQR